MLVSNKIQPFNHLNLYPPCQSLLIDINSEGINTCHQNIDPEIKLQIVNEKGVPEFQRSSLVQMLSLKKIIFLQDQEYVFCFCILSDVFFPNVILNTELTFLVGNIKELVDKTDSHSTKQVWRLHNPELLLVLCHVTYNLLPGNIVFSIKIKI